MTFTLDIVPPKTTSQGAGKRISIVNGKPMFFKDKKATVAQDDYLVTLIQHAPDDPLIGPLKLKVEFVWPFLKGDTKKDMAKGYIWHTSKPDLDNAAKMLKDCMTKAGFWLDDSQVVEMTLTKRRESKGCVKITVEPMK